MSLVSNKVAMSLVSSTTVNSAGLQQPASCVPGMDSRPSSINSDHSDAFVNNNYHLPADTNNSSQVTVTQDTKEDDGSPVIDIIISNVVCTFNTRCYLNLKKIAMEGAHVEYRRENGMLNMKLRQPNTTATIWSSGKITCTGATSEGDAKLAARRIARRLQKLGFNIRFSGYRVVNVLGTCGLPFGIKLAPFSEEYRNCACYEPELHPGVTYRIKEPKATLKVFSTGSITVTAPCVHNVQLAIEHIYPVVSAYKMDTHIAKVMQPKNKYRTEYIGYPVLRFRDDGDEDIDDNLSDDDSDDFSQE